VHFVVSFKQNSFNLTFKRQNESPSRKAAAAEVKKTPQKFKKQYRKKISNQHESD
jgi:hypothetical protein